MVALLVAWFLGLRTAHEGFLVIGIASDPLEGDALALAPALRDAMVQSIVQSADVLIPVGLAELMLGGLLMVLAAVLLFRGRVSVAFTLQVLLANALMAVIGHVLASPVREAMAQALAESPDVLGVEAEALSRTELLDVYRMAFHLSLVLHVGVLAILALAFTRPSARPFLRAAPRPHEER